MRNGETLPASFFEADGDGFRATIATRGPWGDAYQHGGPPAALLARALEREIAASASGPMRASRVNVVFHRPVPIARFAIEVETVRPGKKVRIVRAHLRGSDGKVVASADALFVRVAPDGSPPGPDVAPERPPAVCPPCLFAFWAPDIVGYQHGMELRVLSGMYGTGAMGMWMRMRIPLLSGETPTPLQRTAIAADSGNGISTGIDFDAYTFLNPDVTFYLVREPRGEWVGVDAVTLLADDGIGLASSVLVDERGVIGRGEQGLIIERRA